MSLGALTVLTFLKSTQNWTEPPALGTKMTGSDQSLWDSSTANEHGQELLPHHLFFVLGQRIGMVADHHPGVD